MVNIGLVFALITAFCFAWSSLFMKKGMQKASTESGVFYTIIVNNLMFLFIIVPFLLIKGTPQINSAGVVFFILAGFLGPILGRFSLYSSIRRIGATRSASLKITAPVFSAILAWILLKEFLSWNMALAIIIIISGIYLVISSPVRAEDGEETKPQTKAGFGLGFLAAFFFAATNVSRKAGLQHIPSAIVGSTLSAFAALIAFTIYHLIQGRLKQVLMIDKEAMIKFTYAGLLAGCATFSYFMALKFVPVSVGVALANVEPLFTIALAHLSGIDDEPITLKFISGAVVVLLGVTILVLS